jgi:CDP-glycerol glycerophosphotransferase
VPTTRVSIIIPVHNTASFLPTCLDSILSQSWPDLEVIAVDDGSTDGSRECLLRYSKIDPRLTVVLIDAPGGAGPARNIGLRHAKGDYVWFVDSDDWIEPGSLAQIASALDSQDPDVLLLGWSRRYPTGEVSECPAKEHLEAAPARFALHEWPRAVRILHTPWNKVVRRKLLERTQFQFASGWYQDLSFTYLMLASAESISALPSNLLNYRQRPSGAMSTKSRGHLAVLKQWSSVFELVEAHSPRPDLIYPYLFERMTWHLLEVIRKEERVPLSDWSDFLEGAKQLWARHRPHDYRFPAGAIGLRYRMMAGQLPFARLVPLIARAGSRVRRILGLKPAGRIAA